MSTHTTDTERDESSSQPRSADAAVSGQTRETDRDAAATAELDAAVRDAGARDKQDGNDGDVGAGSDRDSQRPGRSTRVRRTLGNRAVEAAAGAVRDQQVQAEQRTSETTADERAREGTIRTGETAPASRSSADRDSSEPPSDTASSGDIPTRDQPPVSAATDTHDGVRSEQSTATRTSVASSDRQSVTDDTEQTAPQTHDRSTRTMTGGAGDQSESTASESEPGPGETPTGPRDLAERLRSTGAGRPLPAALRNTMEARFDHDFSDVRVHTLSTKAVDAVDARALTYGTDIHFGTGQYRPRSSAGRRLLAHELTHVVQQDRAGIATIAGSTPAISRPQDPTEREARGAARLVEAGTAVAVQESARKPTIHRNGIGGFFSDVGGAVASAASSAYDAGKGAVKSGIGFAGETAQAVGEAASGAVRRGAEFVQESIEAVGRIGRELVERIAPGLIDFLNDPGGRIREVLCSGLDSFLSGAIGMLDDADLDLLGSLSSLFQRMTATVQGVRERISKGISASLGRLLGPLVTVIEEHGLPALQNVQEVIATVQGAFESVWTSVGKPVADFLEEVGGAVWNQMVSLANWVWDLTEPLRDYAQRAWNWVKEKFNIAWESTEGARNWLVDQASSVWESLKKSIEPVMGPLKTVGKTLAVLSPFGPVIALTKVIGPLWEKIKWIWENWNTDDILIRARKTLQKTILPAVIAGISSVSTALGKAATWLTEKMTKLQAAIAPLLGALGISKCIQSVTRIIRFVGDQFTRLAEWARSDFTGLMNAVKSTLNALGDLLRPILDFLITLAKVIINPLTIPLVLAGTLWQLIPDKLKPPIVTFLFELLVTFVKAFPAFATILGPIASIVKHGVLGFLERLRDAKNQVKIDVSNRIARLLSGSLEFAAGFLWGMLRGIWEGLTDPFVIIAMLVQVVVRVSQFLYSWIKRLTVGRSRVRTEGEMPGRSSAPAETGAGGTTAEVGPGARRTTPEARGGPVSARTEEAAPGAERGPAEEPEIVREKRAIETVAAETRGLEGEYGSARERASSRENATSEGLFAMLSSVWGQVVAKAGEIGTSIASALISFFRLPDFKLGDKLGWVGGTVLFEVVLAILTGPAYRALRTAKPVLRGILRLLDLGGEIIGQLGKLLGKARGPVMSGLRAIGGFVRKIPGLGRVFDRLVDALRTLFRTSDEAAAAGRGAREAGEAGAEETGEQVAKETMAEAGPRSGRKAAKEASERAEREVTGSGGRRADEATKAAEYPEALAAARSIAESNDRLDTPVSVLIPALNVLKRRYRWIDQFEARPKGPPGHYSIHMIASEADVDRDYTTGDVPTPGRPEEILDSWKRHRKDPDLLKRVQNALDTGHITPERFKKIMDEAELRHTNGTKMIEYVERLCLENPPGIERVLSDLAKGGNWQKGTEWMLEYIHKNDVWNRVDKFEALTEDGIRQWDAIIGGKVYQFKTWGEFYSKTFVDQILKDFRKVSGPDDLRWVFKERKLGDESVIRGLMKQALRNEQYGVPSATAEQIIEYLDEILIVAE